VNRSQALRHAAAWLILFLPACLPPHHYPPPGLTIGPVCVFEYPVLSCKDVGEAYYLLHTGDGVTPFMSAIAITDFYPPGCRVVYVTAINEDGYESPPSAPITVCSRPSMP